jgi:hypothetical protein
MGAVFIGLAGFAANTAEWVNVVAHVEKEIAVACVEKAAGDMTTEADIASVPSFEWVVTDPVDSPIKTGRGDCNFGTVMPQERSFMVVEVAASKSFLAQTRVINVNYDVLWECKLPDPTELYNPTGEAKDYNGDGIIERNICREELENVNNPLKLDDNIRDFIHVVAPDPGCLLQGPFDVPPVPETGDEGAEIENLGRGQVGDEQEKCFYILVLKAPACDGHVNPNTDPDGKTTDTLTVIDGAPTTIPCHEDTVSDDPQEWDISADLGDDFKIQVVAFEYADQVQ